MPDLGEAAVLYAARPKIKIDGVEDPNLTMETLSLSVNETTEGLYRCELCFGNWGGADDGVGFKHFDRDKLEFGKEVEVEIGSEDAGGRLFKGRIFALEAHFPAPGAQPTISVLADDALQDFRMTRRTRTFEETTDADVFSAIASEHGISADVDVDGPEYPVLSQVNQSDLAFIRDRARAIDAEIWLEEGALRVQARGRRRRGDPLTLSYREGLREFTVCADLATQRTRFRAVGWDVAAKDEVSHEAGEEVVANELNGNESGISLLQSAFGDRPESIVHTTPFGLDEARSRAEACCRRMARNFVTGRGVAEGDVRIRVGAVVRLARLGPLFSGDYYVTRAHHFFDGESGYRTAFQVERVGIGEN